MAYATDADLQKILPNILTFGISSWSDQLDLASADVLEMIKVDWFPNAAAERLGYRSGYLANTIPTLDESRLDTSQLVNLTCYRALARYIMTILTNDAGIEDQFAVKMERYQDIFRDEWKAVKRRPLYDFDNDSQFEDVERVLPRGRGVARA